MSEVKHYFWVNDGMSEGGKSLNTYVKSPDFDRVTAERDGLQISLNTADQSIDDLNAAISRRTHRVRELEGLLRLARQFVTNGVELGYITMPDPETPDAAHDLVPMIDAALKPAEAQLNQCDGCQAGIPVVNGAHRMGKPGAYPDTMSCTAKLYKP